MCWHLSLLLLEVKVMSLSRLRFISLFRLDLFVYSVMYMLLQTQVCTLNDSERTAQPPMPAHPHQPPQKTMHAWFIEQTENSWQLWYENSFPLTYSSAVSKPVIQRVHELWGKEREGGGWYREQQMWGMWRNYSRNSFSAVQLSSGFSTPVCRTDVLLRKRITSRVRRRRFDCFVVNWRHLGPQLR